MEKRKVIPPGVFLTAIFGNKGNATGNTTMGHNSSKDMGNNNMPAKDRFVCLKEGDIDNPFHQEI